MTYLDPKSGTPIDFFGQYCSLPMDMDMNRSNLDKNNFFKRS